MLQINKRTPKQKANTEKKSPVARGKTNYYDDFFAEGGAILYAILHTKY